MNLNIELQILGVASDAWVAAWDILLLLKKDLSAFPFSLSLSHLLSPSSPNTHIRRPLAERPNSLHDIRILPAADPGVFLTDLVESVGAAGQ
jgi:hypothetical protein